MPTVMGLLGQIAISLFDCIWLCRGCIFTVGDDREGDLDTSKLRYILTCDNYPFRRRSVSSPLCITAEYGAEMLFSSNQEDTSTH